MITLQALFVLMFAHWVFDFLCQTQYMATNKSESWKALLSHTGVYSSGMMVTYFLYTWYLGEIQILDSIIFGIITFITHTLVDAVTSTLCAKAYKQERYRKFFNIIGADQYLHFVQLITLYTLL